MGNTTKKLTRKQAIAAIREAGYANDMARAMQAAVAHDINVTREFGIGRRAALTGVSIKQAAKLTIAELLAEAGIA